MYVHRVEIHELQGDFGERTAHCHIVSRLVLMDDFWRKRLNEEDYFATWEEAAKVAEETDQEFMIRRPECPWCGKSMYDSRAPLRSKL